MRQSNRRLAVIAFSLVALALGGCVPSTPAPEPTEVVPPVTPGPELIEVVPPGSAVAGKTIGEWSAEWWKWAYSHSVPDDPFTDVTGEDANRKQAGPVFFLTQSPGENLTRSFTVPANKYILISIIAASISQAEMGDDASVDDLRRATKEDADKIDDVFVRLDGEDLPRVFDYREISPEFSFVGAPNNVFVEFGGPEGESGIAVSDGYFVMLEPPEPGSTHKIEFGGALSEFDFKTNNAVAITIAAEE